MSIPYKNSLNRFTFTLYSNYLPVLWLRQCFKTLIHSVCTVMHLSENGQSQVSVWVQNVIKDYNFHVIHCGAHAWKEGDARTMRMCRYVKWRRERDGANVTTGWLAAIKHRTNTQIGIFINEKGKRWDLMCNVDSDKPVMAHRLWFMLLLALLALAANERAHWAVMGSSAR